MELEKNLETFVVYILVLETITIYLFYSSDSFSVIRQRLY